MVFNYSKLDWFVRKEKMHEEQKENNKEKEKDKDKIQNKTASDDDKAKKGSNDN